MNGGDKIKFDDIIFLGAGASISEGGPHQDELFKDFFNGYNDTKFTRYTTSYEGEGSEERLNEIYDRLANFFKSFFKIDVSDSLINNYPTFEEVLGCLELSLERGESFKEYTFNEIQKVREELILLIALVLDERLHSGHHFHTNLLQRLHDEGTLKNTTFISLNYDILIDKAIIDLGDKYEPDYGVEFTNYSRQRFKQFIPLYKLHGSLNWLYCPTCLSLTIFPERKKVAETVFRSKNCNECTSQMIPIIIPPTFFKVMSNFYLQQIWKKTEYALRYAKRIFFCGYSFPDADIHIKYLLKRAELSNNSKLKIYVINKSANKTEQEGDNERKKYLRFFSKNSKIEYTNESFEDFSKKSILE